MNQFGLGMTKNIPRAQRYYQHALAMSHQPVAAAAAATQSPDGSLVGGAAGAAPNSPGEGDALEVLPTQMRLLVQSLQWMCSSRVYSSYLAPTVGVTVEYAVQLLWGVHGEENDKK